MKQNLTKCQILGNRRFCFMVLWQWLLSSSVDSGVAISDFHIVFKGVNHVSLAVAIHIAYSHMMAKLLGPVNRHIWKERPIFRVLFRIGKSSHLQYLLPISFHGCLHVYKTAIPKHANFFSAKWPSQSDMCSATIPGKVGCYPYPMLPKNQHQDGTYCLIHAEYWAFEVTKVHLVASGLGRGNQVSLHVQGWTKHRMFAANLSYLIKGWLNLCPFLIA